MSGTALKTGERAPGGILHALARDVSGNTLALLAASLLPLLGIIGGGIDMSRSYLAQSRLQQACDAGVLAARKALGAQVAVDGSVSAEAGLIGDRFFNLNFRDGAYGTEDRAFQLYLEGDNSLSGEASVTVPTAVMNVFGFDEVNVAVECGAVLNFQNLDLMMVLDTTGSMRHTNSGDTLSRMDSMKQVIRDFHASLEANKAPGMRLRYGFVPYASNVNVGHLLRDEWVVDEWSYQSRVRVASSTPVTTTSYTTNWVQVSGSMSTALHSTYEATFNPGAPPTNPGETDNGSNSGTAGYYSCPNYNPPSTYSPVTEILSTESEAWPGPPAGTKTTSHRRLTENGAYHYQTLNGTTCEIYEVTLKNRVHTYDYITHPAYAATINEWVYRPVITDVSNWRLKGNGCIEERSTYEIDDYDNVDLARALDLDLDTIPNPSDPNTQWRPSYRELIYTRSIAPDGSGTVTPDEVITASTFAQTGTWWFSDCPAPAQKLAEMSAGSLDIYLATLTPSSATYHDIGMIWGGRLISPDGLFASENGDASRSKPTNRNLIFLTDGQTEPYDLAYGTYGVDALDQRRWKSGSALTLSETIEQRFLAACKEIKKRNITVWVIAFGTELNPAMTECAGDGHYFEASDASELSSAFQAIAESFGDLRISS